MVDGYDFAPSFSIWTTIEECLNPPVIWERDRGWFTTPPFSEPETFEFPEGIGPVECVNVEHEEVLLIPRWVNARRVTFKYGLGDEFIEVLQMLHKVGLDRTAKVRVGGVEVSPRDVVAAALPDPATLGDRMHGKTCAGTWVTGTGKDGPPREVYLYHVVDNETIDGRSDGSQAVVWQTAINPVVALELLATGTWSGAGVLGPEAFAAVPFLDLLTEYGSPWGMREGAAELGRPEHVRKRSLFCDATSRHQRCREVSSRKKSDPRAGDASRPAPLALSDLTARGSPLPPDAGRSWRRRRRSRALASARSCTG